MLKAILGRLMNVAGSLWIVIGLVGLSVFCVVRWLTDKEYEQGGREEGKMAMAKMADSMIGFGVMIFAVTVALGFLYDWRGVVFYVYIAFWIIMLGMLRGIGADKKRYKDLLDGRVEFVRIK